MNYTYNDIAIGDTIVTKSNATGKVVQINSILYLNNMKSSTKNMPNYMLQIDDKRHDNYMYNTITLLVISSDDSFAPYFLAIDFSDIKKIIRQNPEKRISLFDKFKKLFL